MPFLHKHKPIQCNTAEVQDGCCGQQDVQRCSHQAENLSIAPLASSQFDGSKGHHNQSNQQVSKRQRDNKVVCLFLSGRRRQPYRSWRKKKIQKKFDLL